MILEFFFTKSSILYNYLTFSKNYYLFDIDASLYDKFSTSSIVATVNVGTSFENGFVFITLENKTVLYYVTDSSGVFIYDEDWNYKFTKSLTLSGAIYIKQVNNELFISDSKRLIKTDINLNIIKEITLSLNSFSIGISHDDSCNDWIFTRIIMTS
jgi:hypothetical protein